jgi:hypothetical protein
MDHEEAARLLDAELAPFRAETYADLVGRIVQSPSDVERVGPTGTTYPLEVQVLWDARPGGNVRVVGSIDDGGWRAFVPVTRDFIKSPDGAFVGE